MNDQYVGENSIFFPPKGAKGQMIELGDDAMAHVEWWDESEIEFPNDWWISVYSLISLKDYMKMLESRENFTMRMGNNILHYMTTDDGHTYIYKVETLHEWTVDSS